eukprot:8423594-Alexandrium_andersonii.AAC.1
MPLSSHGAASGTFRAPFLHNKQRWKARTSVGERRKASGMASDIQPEAIPGGVRRFPACFYCAERCLETA